MQTIEGIREIALVQQDINLLNEIRSQLSENGSIVLTISDHDQSLNHLANTLFAFKLFLEIDLCERELFERNRDIRKSDKS